MAWRIDESITRGEIDNREKGIVRGRLWLVDREEPVTLELKGNAHADLAGCVLTFENPVSGEPHPQIKGFFPVQHGTVGDMTASRKVRVFDIPFEEAYEMIKQGEKPPEHMANSLYLEWFSEENGRVVIESADYRIQISEPLWQLTKEDEAERAKTAEEGWKGFSQKLTEALESKRHEGPDDIEDWDEFDFEKALRESDALTDKYMELLDKYGDTPESEELIAKEMGWHEKDDEGEGSVLDLDEVNQACEDAEDLKPDPTTEGVDWIRIKDGVFGDDIRHPLQHRCHEDAMALWHACDDLGLRDDRDEDLAKLISQFQITGAKLAGALNSLAYGRDMCEPGFVVACLKRALDHLHKAQAALEKVAPKNFVPQKILSKARQDLFEIREEILRLMAEFRKQSEP